MLHKRPRCAPALALLSTLLHADAWVQQQRGSCGSAACVAAAGVLHCQQYRPPAPERAPNHAARVERAAHHPHRLRQVRRRRLLQIFRKGGGRTCLEWRLLCECCCQPVRACLHAMKPGCCDGRWSARRLPHRSGGRVSIWEDASHAAGACPPPEEWDATLAASL